MIKTIKPVIPIPIGKRYPNEDEIKKNPSLKPKIVP